MRSLTFWKVFLVIIFMGAVWPAMVTAQIVPAAGAAQEARSQEAGLTLEQLQEMALANNPTLGQAKAGVRAAAGRSRQAGLWPNPTIGYSGDEIRGGSFGGGEQGVFVRYFSDPAVSGCIRISVARPRESKLLLDVLRLVRP